MEYLVAESKEEIAMKKRMGMSGFFETIVVAICGFMLICTSAGNVHAGNTCLTEFLSNEMEVFADLTDMKLDYQLPEGTKLGDMKEAKFNKEGTALEKDFEFILPPGSKPEGNIELKKWLEAQAKTGKKYCLPEGTPVKYVLPCDYTYKVIIPKGTILTKESSTHLPQYALARKIRVEISPAKNSQATLAIAAKRKVERVPMTSGMGTTLQVEPKRVPVGGYITVEVEKAGFNFSSAWFHVCLRIQGTKDQDRASFVASKDVELKEVHGEKAKLQVKIPELPGIAGVHLVKPVDLLLVARVQGQNTGEDTISEVLSQEFAISSRSLALICWIIAFVFPWFVAAFIRTGDKPSKGFKGWVDRLNPIGFVSGKYGSASLSLAQILLWTILVYSASLYVLVASGKLLDLTSDVLVLLGIAGTSSVIAKITSSAKDEKGQVLSGVPPSAPKWLDLVTTEGRPDLYKFQMALFTTLAAIFVTGKIYWNFEFPVLPAGLLTLIGISNGVYLSAKATSKTVFEKLAEKHSELDETSKEFEKRKAELTEADSRLTEKEKELKKAKEEVGKIEETLKTAPTEEKVKLNQLLEQLKAGLPKMEDEYKKASDKKIDLDGAVKIAESRVKDFQEQFDKLKKEAAETKS
jgi:hypothetical protein